VSAVMPRLPEAISPMRFAGMPMFFGETVFGRAMGRDARIKSGHDGRGEDGGASKHAVALLPISVIAGLVPVTHSSTSAPADGWVPATSAGMTVREEQVAKKLVLDFSSSLGLHSLQPNRKGGDIVDSVSK
jgi:hypothetical protein